MNILETFKYNIKNKTKHDVSNSYCFGVECITDNIQQCPLYEKCFSITTDINSLDKRNQMILDYVSIQDNLEKW